MRKLTVKNFSVIKDAELEFGKITVLIGPQSSGKSLLCKLAYFLSRGVLEQAVASVISGIPLEEFKAQLDGLFLRQFPDYGWLNESFSAEFVASRFRVTVVGVPATSTVQAIDEPKLTFYFSADFESQYDLCFANSVFTQRPGAKSQQDFRDAVWTSLNLLLSEPFVSEALYIPSGRAFFTDASKGFLAIQNTDLDPLVRQFAPEVSWNFRWRAGLLSAGDGVIEEVRKEMVRIAKGEVVSTVNTPSFHTVNGDTVPLALLSSGTQEILPIFNVLDRLASFQEHREMARKSPRLPPYNQPIVGTKKIIYLEEPEANVFPSTQYELVRLFARLSHEPNLDFSWVITTHSPYILSAFNNMIEAGQLASAKPELKSEVAKIIPEHFWVREGDFRAYSIHEGVLKPILSESGLIDGEYLDSISEMIDDEFDALLRLEDDHTEAS